MKKLYKKGTVHPSPQIKSDDPLLPLLPVALFSLAAVLSPEDREVLAYLLSTGGDRNPTSRLKKTKPQHKKTHSPLFHCDCFTCYTSYWVRWDSSPSRQRIHEIIDAYEDSLENKKKKKINGKKDRRKQRSVKSPVLATSSCLGNDDFKIPSQLSESVASSCPLIDGGGGGLEPTEEEVCSAGDGGEEVVGSSVRRFVSFIGEKVFGVWG